MLQTSALLSQIDNTVEELSCRLLNHPLLELISELENAKFFVGQYLLFAAEIPRITGLRYGLCRDEAIRQKLLAVMIEEEGGWLDQSRCSHYSLAQLTAQSLALDKEPKIHFGTATMLASLESQYRFCLISGLASSYVREGIYPKLMPRITEQLSKASPSVNTIFFDVHAVGDVEHSESALQCLCHLCTVNDLPKLEQAIYLGLGTLLSWYNSLYLELKRDR